MTKQTKQVYEAPTIETLELRFEGIICESPNDSVLGGDREGYGFHDLG